MRQHPVFEGLFKGRARLDNRSNVTFLRLAKSHRHGVIHSSLVKKGETCPEELGHVEFPS
jgi:hypothetical protein